MNELVSLFWTFPKPYRLLRFQVNNYNDNFYTYLERFSIECCKTRTTVITLANHKRYRKSNEPIKTRRK